ncbi:MAG: kelch repeat-containing protein [Bacteroidia bacterium]
MESESRFLPAAARMFAAAFSIGSKGYIGTGSSSSGTLSDFWEYDAISDTWTQKSSFRGQRYEGSCLQCRRIWFYGRRIWPTAKK